MKVSRSILWNVCGTALPLVVGIAVLPTIVGRLGVERFGLLSVIWVVIGYLSLFDQPGETRCGDRCGWLR